MSVRLEPAVLAEVLWALELQSGTAKVAERAIAGICPDCRRPNLLDGDRFSWAGPCNDNFAAVALVSHVQTFPVPNRKAAP